MSFLSKKDHFMVILSHFSAFLTMMVDNSNAGGNYPPAENATHCSKGQIRRDGGAD